MLVLLQNKILNLTLLLFIVLSIQSCSRNTFGCNSYTGRLKTYKYKDKNKKVKLYRKTKKFKFELYRQRSSEPVSN